MPKIINLHNSINKCFSNFETKYLENIILDKNYNIVFDHTINFNGYFVNGLIYNENNEITIKINPYSSESILFILMHEITHAIDKNKLKELVINYLIQKLDLIEDNYIVSDELICDIAGVLLGNTKFLNYLYNNDNYNININNNYKTFAYKFKRLWKALYYNSTINLLTTEYHISNNSLNDIVALLNNNYDTSQDIKLRDYTPKILVQNGIKNLPMLMNSKHILCNILNEQQAKKLNIFDSNSNYHGLGVKLFLNTINSLDKPIAIYRWNDIKGKKYSSNNYIFLTSQKINGKRIIVPIYIETKGNYNYTRLDTNKIKTVYEVANIHNILTQRIKNGEMIKLY